MTADSITVYLTDSWDTQLKHNINTRFRTFLPHTAVNVEGLGRVFSLQKHAHYKQKRRIKTMKKKRLSKIEKQVIQNSSALNKQLPELVKNHAGEFITFHAGQKLFAPTFDRAIQKADHQFGEDAGFVVREVKASLPIFSELVQ